VDLPATPVRTFGYLFGLYAAIAHRIPEDDLIVKHIECGLALWHDHVLLVRMPVLQVVGEVVQCSCFVRCIRITEDSYRRIMLLELVEIAIDIRVTKIVVKDDDWEIHVRICPGTIGVVLPDTGCISQFVCIGRERVPVEEADIVCLLCLLN
jgi:hypothetical protein